MNMLTRPDQPVPDPLAPDMRELATPPDIAPDRHSLFIDFDGTLVPLIDRPDKVRADDELIDLLAALRGRFGGRLALVSGRSVAQLDEMIGYAIGDIALAGSHGAEIRYDGYLDHPPRPAGLDAAIVDVRDFVAKHPQLIAEVKSQGVAIHYRMAPALEAVVQSAAAKIAARHMLTLQPGKKMIELRGGGGDKGTALVMLMEKAAFFGSIPVMIGDDLTDEPALATATRLGGLGVLVGHPRETAAQFRLNDVADVRRWLWRVSE